MVQSTIPDYWSVVDTAIQSNKQSRINWKIKLGMSLNKAIAKFRCAGIDPKLAFNLLCEKHDLSFEERRRLKIGICARYGEQKIAEKEQRKTK